MNVTPTILAFATKIAERLTDKEGQHALVCLVVEHYFDLDGESRAPDDDELREMVATLARMVDA